MYMYICMCMCICIWIGIPYTYTYTYICIRICICICTCTLIGFDFDVHRQVGMLRAVSPQAWLFQVGRLAVRFSLLEGVQFHGKKGERTTCLARGGAGSSWFLAFSLICLRVYSLISLSSPLFCPFLDCHGCGVTVSENLVQHETIMNTWGKWGFKLVGFWEVLPHTFRKPCCERSRHPWCSRKCALLQPELGLRKQLCKGPGRV